MTLNKNELAALDYVERTHRDFEGSRRQDHIGTLCVALRRLASAPSGEVEPVAWRVTWDWGASRCSAFFTHPPHSQVGKEGCVAVAPLFANPHHAAPSAESGYTLPPIPQPEEPRLTSTSELRFAPPAGAEVTDAMVSALRDSLWSTWGKNRQTTDWPEFHEMRAALAAALAGRDGERLAQRGERLAKAGERYVAAINVGMAALVVGATPWADDKDEDAVAAADNEISEALRSLNNAAYEFRKAAGGSP